MYSATCHYRHAKLCFSGGVFGRDHSRQQSFLGAISSRSFELALKKGWVGKTIRIGGSFLIEARK